VTSGILAPDIVLHRIGGARVSNLELSALDRQEIPPGISVLLGGTAQEAANQMRKTFPKSRKWQKIQTVATATVVAVRQAGFDVIGDATGRFPNHARLIHPLGEAGFSVLNLQALAKVFTETMGC
jgi:hypothetical protein